jgi:hypothetical protein
MQEKQILNRISKAEKRIVDLYRKLLSGGVGGFQTLANVLVTGQTTGGNNIIVSDADAIELNNTSLLRKGTYNFSGNGGISRICSNNYEDMWQNGYRHVFDQSGFIRQSSNCFNVVPDNTYDETLRFRVGSLWILDDNTIYKCTDATTNAAVWELYSSPTLDYKSYVVNFSQSGTNPPTITEIFNTVGVVTWTRGSAGNFTGSAIAGTFPSNKTFFPQKQFCRYSESSGIRNIFMTAVGGNLIALSQNDGTSAIDGLNFQLEIRVYN